MINEVQVENSVAENDSVLMRKFLELVPPYARVHVVDACSLIYASGNGLLNSPNLELHCTVCGGMRIFNSIDSDKSIRPGEQNNLFVIYECRNCKKNTKTYAIDVYMLSGKKDCMLFKYGEFPCFGSVSPSRLMKLLGPDREYFLSGRRAESQGMGIGSFAYYRRVVENQKQRIIGEIIRVAERIGASQDVVEQLREAQRETQFSSAVEKTKKGMPHSLLINGHNPLTLLHSALSEGLHAQTDAECLEVATSIRLVLSALAENLGQALKDEAELSAAVSKLLAAKSRQNGRGECHE